MNETREDKQTEEGTVYSWKALQGTDRGRYRGWSWSVVKRDEKSLKPEGTFWTASNNHQIYRMASVVCCADPRHNPAMGPFVSLLRP